MSFSTETHPGVCAQPSAASDGFVLNHCMLRVKDPAVSLDFYTRLFGMRVLRKLDFPEMKFSLYFLHREVEGNSAPEDVGERTAWTFAQHGILELTHNWGTEKQMWPKPCGFALPSWYAKLASFSVPQLWVSSRMPCWAKVQAVRSPTSSGAGLPATLRCRKYSENFISGKSSLRSTRMPKTRV